MSDENVTSSVQDRYAPQFAQELARNEQEQKELEARLAQLRDDHTALSGMLAALGHETTPKDEPATAPATVVDEARAAGDSVPQQRRPRKKPASTGAAEEPKRTKKAAGGAKKSTGAGATEKKPSTKTAAKPVTKPAAKGATKPSGKAVAQAESKPESKPESKSVSASEAKASAGAAKKNGRTKVAGGPTLQDVIAGLLGSHAPERRTVREIFDELKQKHPERASSTQSVRNALNGLLRKGAIEREENQGAVWFGTPATTSAAAAAPEPARPTEAAEPAEPTEEKAKVAAEA